MTADSKPFMVALAAIVLLAGCSGFGLQNEAPQTPEASDNCSVTWQPDQETASLRQRCDIRKPPDGNTPTTQMVEVDNASYRIAVDDQTPRRKTVGIAENGTENATEYIGRAT